MKIGDKVRFLSEVGGGRVAGFQGKNIVLVEDEDGFQVPMNLNEVVVVGDESYDTAHMVEVKTKKKAEPEVEIEPADKPITFTPKPEERRGGEQLGAYLAFVPLEVKELTTTRFETYFVNDSNYYLRFLYLTAEAGAWHLRATAEVEPNTKQFVEEFGREDLSAMERVAVQLIAYKRDKNFALKPAIEVQLRVDPVKFYKLHTFTDSDFFEQPALVYTLVEHDQPVRAITLDPKKMKEAMTAKGDQVARPKPVPRKGDDVVVDLHASELLDTTQGLSPSDILNYQLDAFRKTLKTYEKQRGTKIVFIHGKGEGILRRALLNELQYRYKRYTYQDASFQEYGYGATQVTIK